MGYPPSLQSFKTDGLKKYQPIPRLVEFFNQFPAAKVSCGGEFTVVLASNHQVFAFGKGCLGILGNGKLTNHCDPQQVTKLDKKIVTQVKCGKTHCLALTIDGKVYQWGAPYIR